MNLIVRKHGLIADEGSLDTFLDVLKKTNLIATGFDTETTGLHIISDSPFLYVIGVLDSDGRLDTFLFDIVYHADIARIALSAWIYIAKQVKFLYGHNVKYDMHMAMNDGYDLRYPNLIDTQICIRLAHDAVPERAGGVPMGLKQYSKIHIDRNANMYDKRVQSERGKLAKLYNKELQSILNKTGAIPAGHNSWTIKALDEYFKDVIFEYTDFTNATIREAYKSWYYSLPDGVRRNMTSGHVTTSDIPYSLVPRDVMYEYAEMDIVFTTEILVRTLPVIKQRRNEEGLRIERELIIPLFDMERVGFKANIPYIKESKAKVKQYIKQRRAMLGLIAPSISVGQHAKIKAYINNHGYNVAGTGNEELTKLLPTTTGKVYDFIKLVQELRTLEKWYSTYIIRIYRSLQTTDRMYTQINQSGAASGRVSSDFQQFPKYPIKTEDGEILFHPRKMVTVTGDGYNEIWYLDYSQIELRVQAVYTILLNEPDLNLCRAYMPLKCVRKDGTKFDFHNPAHIAQWDDKSWYLEEEPDTLWKKVDLHGVTTKMAFGIDETHPDFKKLRGDVGKRVNFAKNYGAQKGRIREMYPDMSEEQITQLDEAYYKAYPSVKLYHQYCYQIVHRQAAVSNLFGVLYYNVSGHNLINMLVQGSSAYLLKLKIIELHRFLKPYKTRMQMNIHDEISYERHESEPLTIVRQCQKIQSTWEGAPIPIVSDAEVTYTTWDEKQEVSLSQMLS